VPQIRPLADIVHSQYSFTYLLTLGLEEEVQSEVGLSLTPEMVKQT